jgi:uncharacterized membrane protein
VEPNGRKSRICALLGLTYRSIDKIPLNAAETSIVVNAPVAQVYEQWLRFEDLPKFIKSLGEVQRIDDKHFSFHSLRDGKEERGVIEVVRQIPVRRIAWRTITEEVGLGVVLFEPCFDNATEVILKLRSILLFPVTPLMNIFSSSRD